MKRAHSVNRSRLRTHQRWLVAAALTATGLLAAACTSSSPGPDNAHSSSTSPDTTDPIGPSGGQVTGGPAVHRARPNIVFVLTDDLSDNLVPYMPHVLAMQRQGTSLSKYFVVDSLCCPSRSAIFTGQYPHDNGVFTNNLGDGGYDAFNRFGDAAKTFAVSLHKAGYRTGMMGKYLNGYGPTKPIPPGWDSWAVTGNGYGEYNYTLNVDGKQEKHGHKPADYLNTVLGKKAHDFIARARTNPRPFALEIATFTPHYPYRPAPSDIGSFAGLKAPRTAAYNRKPTGALPWLGQRPPLTPRQERAIDRSFEERVEAVQSVDRMVGDLRHQLAREGLLDNTYFVFSSDNGYHMGEYGLLPGKQTAFDTDIKVPFVVTGPDITPGSTIDSVVPSIDVAPTFEAIGHATPAGRPDGTSFLPLLSNPKAPWAGRAALIEHHHHGSQKPGDPDRQNRAEGYPPTYEALRTADALFVEYVDGEQEFYNLASDPEELHNLAASTPKRTLERYLTWLHALQNCHGATQCRAASTGP